MFYTYKLRQTQKTSQKHLEVLSFWLVLSYFMGGGGVKLCLPFIDKTKLKTLTVHFWARKWYIMYRNSKRCFNVDTAYSKRSAYPLFKIPCMYIIVYGPSDIFLILTIKIYA